MMQPFGCAAASTLKGVELHKDMWGCHYSSKLEKNCAEFQLHYISILKAENKKPDFNSVCFRRNAKNVAQNELMRVW